MLIIIDDFKQEKTNDVYRHVRIQCKTNISHLWYVHKAPNGWCELTKEERWHICMQDLHYIKKTHLSFEVLDE